MSQKASSASLKLKNRNDENRNSGPNESFSRKRKSSHSETTVSKDEHPAKVSRRITDENYENQPVGKQQPSSRKRKAILQDISNKLDESHSKSKICRRSKSDTELKTSSIFDTIEETAGNVQSSLSQDVTSFSEFVSKLKTSSILDTIEETAGNVESSLSQDVQEFTVFTDKLKTNCLDTIKETTNSVPPSLSQDASPLDEICDHFIIDVMDHLPLNDRLSFAATCKRFSDILTDNPNRLPIDLKVNFDTENFPELTRSYRNIAIRNLVTPTTPEREESVMKVFKQMNKEVTKVVWMKSKVSLGFVNQVLETMPRLKFLFIDNSTEIGKGQLNETFEPVTLSALETVHVNDCNAESIAKILRNVTTLQEFVFKTPKYHEHSDGGEESDHEHTESDASEIGEEDIAELAIPDNDHAEFLYIQIIRWESLQYDGIKDVLRRQANLTTLEISHGNFFENSFENCDFQLRNLVLFIPWSSQSQLVHIRDFILYQTHLEQVVINILCAPSPKNRDMLREILRDVMGRTTMKALKIVFYHNAGMIDYFRDNRTVNPMITEFYMGMCPIDFSHRQVIEAIVRHFPKLEKLDLCLDGDWLENSEAETFAPLSGLQNLQSLRMEHVKAKFLTQISIPSLKIAHMKVILDSTIAEWQQFFQNNKNVAHLSCQFIHCDHIPLLALLAAIPDVVEFVRCIADNLAKVRDIHVCSCGKLVTLEQKDQISTIFNASPSMKSIGFCGWKQEK